MYTLLVYFQCLAQCGSVTRRVYYICDNFNRQTFLVLVLIAIKSQFAGFHLNSVILSTARRIRSAKDNKSDDKRKAWVKLVLDRTLTRLATKLMLALNELGLCLLWAIGWCYQVVCHTACQVSCMDLRSVVVSTHPSTNTSTHKNRNQTTTCKPPLDKLALPHYKPTRSVGVAFFAIALNPI